MSVYKVTVCQVGYSLVEADSSEKAKELVNKLPQEEFCWYNPSDQEASILVVDAVLQDE